MNFLFMKNSMYLKKHVDKQMFVSYYSKTRLWRCNLLDKYYYQVYTYFLSSKKCGHCEVITDKTKDLEVRNWTYINYECENDRKM